MNGIIKYGKGIWELAILEGVNIICDAVKKSKSKQYCVTDQKMSYTKFALLLKTISFEPHNPILHELLGDISKYGVEHGLGMLSVFVVHKEGDMMPGNGFFDYAKKLGFKFKDKVSFWIEQVNVAYANI